MNPEKTIRKRGLTAIDGALALITILLIVQNLAADGDAWPSIAKSCRSQRSFPACFFWFVLDSICSCDKLMLTRAKSVMRKGKFAQLILTRESDFCEHLPTTIMITQRRDEDWNPKSEQVLRDQRAAYDEMRRRCPVAYSEFLGWSLFRHDDVTRALHDHETFSNAVSQHLNVPNGMDPPEHTQYRRIIERYFSSEKMAAFEPVCRIVASELLRNLTARTEVEFIAEIALPFAVYVQCAFLGWPEALRNGLIEWTRKNHDATLARDRKVMSDIALEFEAIIDDLLETRRQTNAEPDTDLTSSLMHESVWGRPLSNEEVASILRNWTVGEIGTISASVGILVEYLSRHQDLQTQLRTNRSLLPPAIDEILRIHGPLVANRRVTTRPVEIGGRKIEAGERVTLMWISANRDETVFTDPDTFRLDRDASKNLLYGAGIHVCPGAPLARLELRVFMDEFLSKGTELQTIPEQPPTLDVYPASGFATLPLKVR